MSIQKYKRNCTETIEVKKVDFLGKYRNKI